MGGRTPCLWDGPAGRPGRRGARRVSPKRSRMPPSTARSSLSLPLRTTVVGSYPQPEWLVDHAMLSARLPPRVRAREIWRVPEQWLQEAQDDATLIAIRDMERAGIDLITDGEMRRESYSNRFATA